MNSIDHAIDIDILDALKALLPVILVVIALLFAVAVRIVSRPGGIRVSADDPYFFPIGECPIVPESARALRQNESGGRAASPRSSAAAFTFVPNAKFIMTSSEKPPSVTGRDFDRRFFPIKWGRDNG